MKHLWVIANWKSNKNVQEALQWVDEVGPKLERRDNLKIVVCPTFDNIAEVKKSILVGNYPMMVGSQDLSPFDTGAYTGEEPASILRQFVDLSILGHSERRENFKETDEMVEEKFNQAKNHGIIPLVCLQGAETPVPSGCQLVAYEPVFAIGTGNPDTPENANKVASVLKSRHGQTLKVLYGGSVNSSNCKAFTGQENISGLLIGKASLDAQEFLQIIKECSGL